MGGFPTKSGFCFETRFWWLFAAEYTFNRQTDKDGYKRKKAAAASRIPTLGLCFFEVAAAAALFEVLEYIVERLIERRFQAFFHYTHYFCFKD